MAKTETILYIEDNPDNRVLVRRLLFHEGYNTLEAENAEDAMKVLAESRPNLILMDINMPDVDGYTLTSRIKSMPEMANIPVVAITANVMRGDRERVLQAGCDGYIEKPIDVDNFLDQIAQFLQLGAQQTQ